MVGGSIPALGGRLFKAAELLKNFQNDGLAVGSLGRADLMRGSKAGEVQKHSADQRTHELSPSPASVTRADPCLRNGLSRAWIFKTDVW